MEHHDQKFFRKMEVIGVAIFVIFAMLAAVLYLRISTTEQERSDTKATLKRVVCYASAQSIKTAKTTDQAAQIERQTTVFLAKALNATPCGR